MTEFKKREAAQQIRKLLTDVAETLNKKKKTSDDEWTKEIKKGLHKLGERHRLKTCASGIENEPKWGEWLYDLCWVRAEENKETGWDLESIPFVVESEWGRALWHIVADFDKLMLARSELKLMIYQDIPGKNVKQIGEDLAERVAKFSGASNDDLYLLAGYDNGQMAFTFLEISFGPMGWSCEPIHK